MTAPVCGFAMPCERARRRCHANTLRRKMPTSSPRSPWSRASRERTWRGNDNTHCRYGAVGSTRSTRCAAVLVMRRLVHDGQKPRVLHENATSRSSPQSPQRTRTKPWQSSLDLDLIMTLQVLQSRGVVSSDGSLPPSTYLRAVFRSMPAFIAACPYRESVEVLPARRGRHLLGADRQDRVSRAGTNTMGIRCTSSVLPG